MKKQKKENYGHFLNEIFQTSYSDLALFEKLYVLEKRMHHYALDATNTARGSELLAKRKERIQKSLENLLNYSEKRIQVFINTDPRGYALKIRKEWIIEHLALSNQIITDWNGDGLLAPKLT